MTQTLDVGEGFRQIDDATGAPTSTQASVKFGTFAITFGIAFPLLYTVYERLNWPLFTYHPVSGIVDFGRQPAGVGPPMFWYGWIVLAAASALVVGWIATMVPGQWLRRATVFCCALAALWPASLEALRYFIIYWATFDADFLNSVWVAAIPGFVGAAAITYYVPARLGGPRMDELAASRADRRTRRPRLFAPPAVVSTVVDSEDAIDRFRRVPPVGEGR